MKDCTGCPIYESYLLAADNMHNQVGEHLVSIVQLTRCLMYPEEASPELAQEIEELLKLNDSDNDYDSVPEDEENARITAIHKGFHLHSEAAGELLSDMSMAIQTLKETQETCSYPKKRWLFARLGGKAIECTTNIQLTSNEGNTGWSATQVTSWF